MQLLLSLVFILIQCAPSTNVEADQNKTVKVQPSVQTKKVHQKRDSIPPTSRFTHRDKSRRTEAINAKFPFDIPLENTKREVAASNELIPNNGKPTLVLFWLTTCYPCRLEMKAIAGKYNQWRAEENFNIVAISTDWDKNYDNFVKMVDENNWPWKSYRDLNREFRKIMPGELNGLPQSFIFDKEGNIAYHSRKYRSGDEDKIFDKIKSLNKL